MVRGSMVGTVILGLGRALGETMAVLMVSGGAINYLPHTILTPISTMRAWFVGCPCRQRRAGPDRDGRPSARSRRSRSSSSSSPSSST